jgi:hypothetical protein
MEIVRLFFHIFPASKDSLKLCIIKRLNMICDSRFFNNSSVNKVQVASSSPTTKMFRFLFSGSINIIERLYFWE